MRLSQNQTNKKLAMCWFPLLPQPASAAKAVTSSPVRCLSTINYVTSAAFKSVHQSTARCLVSRFSCILPLSVSSLSCLLSPLLPLSCPHSDMTFHPFALPLPYKPHVLMLLCKACLPVAYLGRACQRVPTPPFSSCLSFTWGL